MGLAALAGGLAFVGSAEAVELVVDGSFENTVPSSNPIVNTGGTANPGVGQGWSVFSTYAYSANYTLPLTNGLGVAIGGLQYLRPYPAGLYGIAQSSTNVFQEVSLTASTTLTPAKIDSGLATFTMSAWFCTYLTQNDYSDLTLTFLDSSTNVVGTPIPLGGAAFVAALPSGPNAKYANARYWGQDMQTGTIPAGARNAQIYIAGTALAGPGVDGYVDLVSLDVVDTSQTLPVIASASPADNAISVGPVVNITVQLQDRVTAVNTNSIQLHLDNNLVVPSIQKAGTNTTVTYAAGLLSALSTHAYAIAFSDNGTPPTTRTNTFHFTVANYLTLSSALGAPIGSEDATKPGFNVHVYQVDNLSDPNAVTLNLPNSIEFDETVLAGLVATNVADLSGAVAGNSFVETNAVHWANSAGNTPNFPNPDPFPGIPGTSASENDFVDEVLTFLKFPAAGFYQIGVNNNDEFRLSAAQTGSLTLTLTSPTNTAVPCVAIATNITQLLFGGALPLTPLTAQVVYGTPSGNPDDACFVSTNSGLAGKIALLDRGSTNCSSADIAYQAQLAGAVAVLETTPGDTGFPHRLGDSDSRVNIPVLVLGENFGGVLLKSFLTNHIAVSATIHGDAAPRIAEWDGPKLFGSADSLAGFAVPTAGVYPMRLLAGHATGGADLEWFSILPGGTRILVNDTSTPGALLAFRALTVSLRPVLNQPVLAGGLVTLSWTGTGTLEEATSANGPYQPSANQANPQTVPASGAQKFYRILAGP
jgi:PA domain